MADESGALSHKAPHNVALYVAGGAGVLLLLYVASKGSGGASAQILQKSPQAEAADAQASAAVQVGEQQQAVALAQTAAAEKVQLTQLQDAIDYGLHTVKSTNYQARISARSQAVQDRIAERGQVVTTKIAAGASGYNPSTASVLEQIQQEISALVATLTAEQSVPVGTNPSPAPVQTPVAGPPVNFQPQGAA